MVVIVVGGGKTGSYLAQKLLAGGHQVRIIDQRPDVIAKLGTELPEEAIVQGDGTDPKLLSGLGIRNADVVAAVTGNDQDNLVVCTIARFEFGVSRIIARICNPKNAWLFTADNGVDVAINQSDFIANLIAEEMSLGDMMTLLKLRKGEYAVVEEKVHPTALVVGKSVREVRLPTECTFAAIIRKGRLIIPHGNTVLQATDEVLAVVHSEQVNQLALLLGPAATPQMR